MNIEERSKCVQGLGVWATGKTRVDKFCYYNVFWGKDWRGKKEIINNNDITTHFTAICALRVY